MTDTVETTETTQPVDTAQRRAARVIGALYLVLMAAGVFAQIYVPGTFPGADDTAQRFLDHERLLRVGAAVDLLCDVGDAALAVAYFVLLRKISWPLAALGAFWRLAQVAVLAAYTLTNTVVLQLVSGGDEVRALDPDQAAALAWVATSAHAVGYSIGLVFLGLGSTVFAYLLYRSRYVPRWLAGLGVAASALLAAGSLVTIAFPEATAVVNPALYAPMFVFEMTTGVLLLVRGVR
ncbi:DUF4386 domain-containing protein [Dactylosporangium sp. NPDC049742]|uniref:DUF4386 domain-containing protein n=1 Tax=Dactylosporangium sp. NPDC049742 TaxID=3154737 RepID=UPI003449E968